MTPDPYIRRAIRLRERLSDKALAKRRGMTLDQVRAHIRRVRREARGEG